MDDGRHCPSTPSRPKSGRIAKAHDRQVQPLERQNDSPIKSTVQRQPRARHEGCKRQGHRNQAAIVATARRDGRGTGEWPSSRKANLLWNHDGQTAGPTPKSQQQGPQPTQHRNSQLIGSTRGVKCHVTIATVTGIPPPVDYSALHPQAWTCIYTGHGCRHLLSAVP